LGKNHPQNSPNTYNCEKKKEEIGHFLSFSLYLLYLFNVKEILKKDFSLNLIKIHEFEVNWNKNFLNIIV